MNSNIEGTIANIDLVTDDKNRNIMKIKIVLSNDEIKGYEEGKIAKIIVHL